MHNKLRFNAETNRFFKSEDCSPNFLELKTCQAPHSPKPAPDKEIRVAYQLCLIRYT